MTAWYSKGLQDRVLQFFAPLLFHKQSEVLIREGGGRVGPRTPEPAPVGVTVPQTMRAAQRHDLAIIEAHAVKNVSDVLRRGFASSYKQETVGLAGFDVRKKAKVQIINISFDFNFLVLFLRCQIIKAKITIERNKYKQ